MHLYSQALLCLVVVAPWAHVHADSVVFSRFIGSTVATPPATGTFDAPFTICTDYLHGLPGLSGLSQSLSAQLEQEAVDGVCEFCTGLAQSRIDSCCGVATSSACFDQFAPAGAKAGPTGPASVSATPTAPFGAGSTSKPSSSKNAAPLAQNKDLVGASFVAAMIGVIGLVL